MNKLLITSILLFILTSLSVHSQTADTISLRDGLSFKYVAVDYHTPEIDGFAQLDNLKHAVEVAYIANLTPMFSFAFPFKVGNADLSATDGKEFDSESFYSLDILMRFHYDNGRNFLKPYAFFGAGANHFADRGMSGQLPFGLGMSFRISKDFMINLQGEYRMGFENNPNHFHYGLGIIGLLNKKAKKQIEEPIIELPPADEDGDGIVDADDKCPKQAGLAAFSGCPDTDKDGVEDKKDRCPDMAGSLEMNGCPDGDGDGVSDIDDRCPTEAGSKENSGCPVIVVKDADGDGFADADDECPNVAGSLRGCPDKDNDGFADKNDPCPNSAGSLNGCPDIDNDGVADKDDKCPNKAGTLANSGCPEIKKEEKEVLNTAMRAVQFETGSARLKSSSNQVLNQIADIMNRYPEYNLTIAGHTDHIGSSSTNQKLSENRAKACYNYLLNKDITASRINYVGYGEKQPIANNKYKAGREKNRRVEFTLYLR